MKKGFTLIEILLVIAIIGILSVISIKAMSKFRNQGVLDATVEGVVSVIRQAQNLTLASKQDSRYGVHLEPSRVILFKGTTFSEGDSSNVVSTLQSQITITNINLHSGGSDIVFDRLTGETSNYGTTTISVSNGSVNSRYVVVEKSGIINLR